MTLRMSTYSIVFAIIKQDVDLS